MKDTTMIEAVVVALGSNHQADIAFDKAYDALQQLGRLTVSQMISGEDFTGRSQRIYHNCCAYIVLTKQLSYTDIIHQFKIIEQNCGRNPAKKCAAYDYEVAMDIDVLAVQVEGIWQLNSARLPFKQHDLVGVQQVADFLLCDSMALF